MDEKFAKWKGVDRNKIKWNPKIEEKKCTGCGMCITSCGRDVFDFDKKRINLLLHGQINVWSDALPVKHGVYSMQ